jgi:hypothetical protein
MKRDSGRWATSGEPLIMADSSLASHRRWPTRTYQANFAPKRTTRGGRTAMGH